VLFLFGHPEDSIPSLIKSIHKLYLQTPPTSTQVSNPQFSIYLQREVTYEEINVENRLSEHITGLNLNIELNLLWGSTCIHIGGTLYLNV
jgi:hypothetical protein